ncbi:DinB family protein [Desulfosporosinus sp. FKB]|uniref:DinB family protein n=1 Tax=Desulfosporosinus sp. FKB TaxID=1969835 RepID=UPI000B4A20A0|nr:DinB family protein [Desulfosporosinus sp. FKB]
MFSSIASFLETWKRESELTLEIFKALTDDSLDQRVTKEDRTIGRLAWHIAITIPEMMSKTGLVFEGFLEDAPVPSSVKDIINYYENASESMKMGIIHQWNDQTLLEDRNMYGESWTIAMILNVLVNHQIHHRGQMTVLMRQAGLKVPGIYGPAREDWSKFGMEPPLI